MLSEIVTRIVGTCASSYSKLIGRAAKVGGPVSAAVATLADLGAPVAASNAILAVLCVSVTVLAAVMWFGRYQREMRLALADGKISQEEMSHATETNGWAVTFAFGMVGSIMLGFAVCAQALVPKNDDGGPDRGVLATLMPALQKVQDSVFRIEKKVDAIAADTTQIKAATTDIKTATAEIKTTTADIKTDTTVMRQQTAQVVAKLDDLAKVFEEASKRDGLIAEPQTPAEHYHNARFAEVKSDFATARKSYNAFLASGVEFIDPYLAYTDMLKVQDGVDGAREVVTALRKNNTTLSLEAAAALLLPKAQRLTALEALAAKAPEFAPAAYLISREFSAEKLGDQTIADKNAEKKWLDGFRALNEAGKFQKYILDKKEGKKWLDDVEARAARIAAMPAAVLKNPVTLTAMQSNDGWMLTFGFADYKIRKVEWRPEGQGDFKDTGLSTTMNSQTGQPMPNLFLSVGKVTEGDHAYEVRYEDMAGQMNGPYKVSFNTAATTLAIGKQVLGGQVGSWIHLRDYNGELLCYFTTLLSYRSSLKTIRYSLDSEALDKTFPFKQPPPGKSAAGIDFSAPIHLSLPTKTRFVAVQLEYADGTLSEVKKFSKD